jgi:predicted nucleotidyltransferase
MTKMKDTSNSGNLGPDEKQHVINKIKDFLLRHQDIVFAYLFGSMPGNDFFEDIDVAVFLDEAPSLPMKREAMLSQEMWEHVGNPALEFDVKVLNTAPSYFQHEVLKDGHVIFSRNEKRRIDFESRTVSVYLDYKPVLEFFNRRLLEKSK